MNKVDIEELIADARAEEAIARGPKIQATPIFDRNEVTISLKEYTELVNKSQDLDRIVNGILLDLDLNYNGDRLRINGERVLETFRVLYPVLHEEVLKDKLAEKSEEKEGK